MSKTNVNITSSFFPTARCTGHHWSSLVITCHHWSSLVITGYHWSSLVITGYHWSSLVITGHQWSSLVITGHHWLSLVITGYHWSSVVITGHHRSSLEYNTITSVHLSNVYWLNAVHVTPQLVSLASPCIFHMSLYSLPYARQITHDITYNFGKISTFKARFWEACLIL